MWRSSNPSPPSRAPQFTSNWQSSVFKSYGVSSMAMMLYANLFSSAFTALGLIVTLEIVDVLAYFERNPSILPHMAIMVCSPRPTPLPLRPSSLNQPARPPHQPARPSHGLRTPPTRPLETCARACVLVLASLAAIVQAVCSAIGQLFIFHTIKRFGPLVFATIQVRHLPHPTSRLT